MRSRRVETIVSIADSNSRSAGRSFHRRGLGTKSGMPSISNGSIRPIVSKYCFIARRISSASRPIPSEKIVRSRTSRVTRVASTDMSVTCSPRLASRPTIRSATSTIALEKPITALRANSGAKARRCVRQLSPSAVNRPRVRPAESTRRCNQSFS